VPEPDLPLVVLLAGAARRFGGRPKALVPVGPAGESILDLLAADARAAGFSRLVLVVRPELEEQVLVRARGWRDEPPVAIAHQHVPAGRDRPRGTAEAVLAARAAVAGDGRGGPGFAVANGDDVYGPAALALAARHLRTGTGGHGLVAFPVADTLLSDRPVSRALCQVAADGRLLGLAEGVVERVGERLRWTGAGRAVELGGNESVSVNLWAFRPDIVAALDAAVHRFLAAGPGPDDEVRLPDVVADLLPAQPVTVLPAPGRCYGITHPDDEAAVRACLAAERA
jgi:hypothetical protein